MSQKYPGGIITKSPVTPSGSYNNSTASGIWTLDQQAYWQKLGQWPTAGNAPPDPQFNYVTMLLHGDGTNGAQNNTFLDSSTNNFTVTRYGNTTQGSFSPYGSNWSNYFDGSGDYLSVPDNAALEGFTNFTFECWVNVSNFSSGDCIFAKGWTPGGFTPYMFYFTSTDLVFYASSSLSGWDVASGEVIVSNIVKNQWYHVAASRSGSSIKLFANGAVTTSFTGGSTLGTNAGAFTIGASLSGDRDPTMYVSNLRINNTALYTAAFTPSTTPLTAVSGTALLTCADSRFIDDSTNNFTLTPNGNTSVQRFNPFGASAAYSTSVIGGSGYFDGSGDDVLQASANVAFTLDADFTVDGWVYPITQVKLYPAVFTIGANFGSADSIILYFNHAANSNKYLLYVNDTLTITGTIAPGDNNWHYFALTRSGNTWRLFVNGVLDGSATRSGTVFLNTPPAVVASESPGRGITNFTGYISNFRIVKGTALYTSAFTPPTAPSTVVSGTSLLLYMTNGAIFDNAMMNDLETVGSAQISTSVKKFGTGSLSIGSVAYLTIPSLPSLNYGAGNFTVELWMYSNSAPGSDAGVIDQRPQSTNGNYFMLGVNSSNQLFIYVDANYRIGPTSGTAIANSTWYHVAYVRSSTTGTLYINGTSVGTWADTTTYLQGAGFIGHHSFGAADFNGYMDDIRITTGYARYTANFTPPTAAFSNLGPP